MGYLLHQLLSESAAKYPEKEAIVYKDDSMTYAELDGESNVLASGLEGIGIERGDRVGIYMERSLNSIVGLFGILKAGAAYVPIDPLSPPNRLTYMLSKCGIKYLLTTKEKLANIEKVFPENIPA